jgi:hypothetical protein
LTGLCANDAIVLCFKRNLLPSSSKFTAHPPSSDQRTHRLRFNKTVVTRHRISLEQRHYASPSISLRLAALRRLVCDAADCGLPSADLGHDEFVPVPRRRHPLRRHLGHLLNIATAPCESVDKSERGLFPYWTVRVTTPELVTWCVCGGAGPLPLFPPQPVSNARTATSTSPIHAVSQIPRAAVLFLMNRSGNRRIGSTMNAVATSGNVSVNTTVI